MKQVMETADRRCGAIFQNDRSVRWRVWAPKAKRVELVLINDDGRDLYSMVPEERGYFTWSQKNVECGQRYTYRLDGGPERPDPASRWQPDGVNQPSAVLCTNEFTSRTPEPERRPGNAIGGMTGCIPLHPSIVTAAPRASSGW